MSYFNQYDPNEPMHFEVDLDISNFVRTAVRKNLKRNRIIEYLGHAAITPKASKKVKKFFPVAQEYNLSRNEILIWMHITCGGSGKPQHISDHLRIPLRWVENALTVLEAKYIIGDGRVL